MKIDPITEQDVAMLNEYLHLDAEAGQLIWKKKIAKKIVPGMIAGSNKKYGYRCFQIFERRILVHRAIYAMTHGSCVSEIDHINGNPADNRPCNLREVTRSQQNMNKRPSRKNKLGLQGVCHHSVNGLYYARVRVNGKRISLGYYKTPEEAHQAYLRGVEQYHGEYRRAA